MPFTDSQGRPAWMQTMEKCKNFNGIQNKTCRAGVAYQELRGEGNIYILPCWLHERAKGDRAVCAHATYPTEEEAKAEEAEREQSIRDYFAAIERDECPVCHQQITKKQVGRCVYGSCGHRLYQGRLPK